jgi:hypothetical protein
VAPRAEVPWLLIFNHFGWLTRPKVTVGAKSVFLAVANRLWRPRVPHKNQRLKKLRFDETRKALCRHGAGHALGPVGAALADDDRDHGDDRG